MYDLKDVTFTIPVKIDQPDRKRNLNLTTRYLKKYFNTNIIICEMDNESKAKECIDSSIDYKYVFMKTDSPWFHRTKMLNYMADLADTPIVVNYDADVLFNPESYVKAVEMIRNGYADVVYPFDGNFLDIHPKQIPDLNEKLDHAVISNHTCRNLRPNGDSVGGAIFWSKEHFKLVGMENENFISWGFEDDDRYYRAQTLGLNVKRCDGPLYHLHHGSSANSSTASHPFYKSNEQELRKIQSMDKNQLREYVNTWKWIR